MLRVLLALLLLLHGAAFAACTPPTDVTNRVGRAYTFTYAFTTSQYANYSSADSDYTWANTPPTATFRSPTGVLSSYYVAVNRYPANGTTYMCGTTPAHDLAWFRANHPEWILLKADRATVAYYFGDTTYIPLDISQGAVQSFFITNQINVIISCPGGQGVSFDNVGATNDFGVAGTCSVAVTSGDCTTNGGTWRALYDGGVDGHCNNGAGSCFTDDQVSWLTAARTVINAGSACASANVGYVPAQAANTTSLIDSVNIWFDEQGWTGDQHPPICSLTSASASTGAKWIDKLAYVAQRAAGNGVVVETNAQCTITQQDRQIMQWAVGSGLLVKGARLYTEWYFGPLDDAGMTADQTGGTWPELFWTHGASVDPAPGASPPYGVASGTYYRIFANGLVLVNPSETAGTTYDLGSALYHGFDGLRYTGPVYLPPTTALMLKNGGTTSSVPTR